MKDVIISIKSSTQPEGDEVNSVELETEGHYDFRDGAAEFEYMESELTCMDGTKTEFSVTPESVTITRRGSVNSQMLFVTGERSYFAYGTPFGTATLGLDTKVVRAELGADGGNLELKYNLDADNVPVSKNHVQISIREV